ncbi:putative homeobox transcription factor [Heterostelium album PN500]|uniref:Putative homeobox transcription factor n=1 Tax=Heterostelium pallidum (strain ATCC 26659 / Pp 5 / PN500) TaxID=670386 RepID=D3BVI4_HETP5|nr:putative homeobox transcription factor [Heterostelium album PN500]EFA74607.1 putative homeobox transcription factor [Heterostelium album PN500]|eukprot:XP_020426741.1 putative homeobox transcription factor [Heterostelium album PN500]
MDPSIIYDSIQVINENDLINANHMNTNNDNNVNQNDQVDHLLSDIQKYNYTFESNNQNSHHFDSEDGSSPTTNNNFICNNSCIKDAQSSPIASSPMITQSSIPSTPEDYGIINNVHISNCLNYLNNNSNNNNIINYPIPLNNNNNNNDNINNNDNNDNCSPNINESYDDIVDEPMYYTGMVEGEDENRFYDTYQQKILNMVTDIEKSEFHIKFLNFLVYLSGIQFFPTIEPCSKFADEPINFDLTPFIKCQKLDLIHTPQFAHTVSVLESFYKKELLLLDNEQSKRINQLSKILNLCLHVKPLLYQETDSKYKQIRSTFQVIKSFQKSNSCDIILKIQKTYSKEHKHRRILSAEQEECMNNWFSQHSKFETGPYPEDAEKSILGALNNLSKSQLDNWFGNKRMRNKLKRQKTEQSYQVEDDDDDESEEYESESESNQYDEHYQYNENEEN